MDAAGIASVFYSSWHTHVLGLMALIAILAAVLYGRRPQDRRSVGNTVALAMTGLGAMLAVAATADHELGWLTGFVHEAAVIVTGVAIIRLCGQLVFRVVLPLAGLKPPRIAEDMVVMLAYVVWGLVRLRVAGLDLSGIVATSAVVTAVIAFSLQDTLGNILGGLALELDSGFDVGDWIMIDDIVGQVLDIRWRSVSLRTRNDEIAIVPNSHVVRTRVIVLGHALDHPGTWRRRVAFAVSLAVMPAKVIDTVQSALTSARIANMAIDPAPSCILTDFDNGFARYAVRYWLIDFAHDEATDSAVREHVLAALQRAGMRLAVPEQSVHVVAEDRAHAEDVAQRELKRRMAALRSVVLFDELNTAEIERLAARLVPAPFVAGEVVTRQGTVAHWLYILTAGAVDVTVERSGRGVRTVAALQAPTLFGEMGLLTGEPRHATVIARSAVECYRLEKSAFEDILMQRPALAERMSQVLATRQAELERSFERIEPAGEAHASRMSEEILAKIKRFFGIAGSAT